LYTNSADACEQVVQAGAKTLASIASVEAASSYGLQILARHVGDDENAQSRYIVIAAVDTDVSSSSPSESESGSAPSSRQNRVIDPLNLRHQILANVIVITRRPPTIPSPNLPRKRSLVLFMRNAPGAIFRMSSCFALRDIDIIKMESRPSTTAMNLNLGVRLDHPLHSVRGDGGSVARHWNQIFYVDFTPSTLPEVNAALLGNLREYALYLRELGDYCAAREDDVRAKPAQWSAYMKEILMLA